MRKFYHNIRFFSYLNCRRKDLEIVRSVMRIRPQTWNKLSEIHFQWIPIIPVLSVKLNVKFIMHRLIPEFYSLIFIINSTGSNANGNFTLFEGS